MASLSDYEPLTNPAAARREEAASALWSDDADTTDATRGADATPAEPADAGRTRLRAFGRGHALTFAGFFIFTVFVYFRPYELIPALAGLNTTTFWVAFATLCLFVPAQLSLENNLTARPSEVNYLLLLCLMALLSIPLAIDPFEAWENFYGGFLKYALMFVVMVNVVRTERRLRWMLLLALAVTCTVSVGVLNDYRLGNLTIEGYRVKSMIGSMLENPNDLAIHLVTMMPLAAVLGLSARGLAKKVIYGAVVVLILSALVVTFSRGGFLGMAAAVSVLAWKLGRRNRLLVFAALVAGGVLFLTFAPGNYWLRLASIIDSSLDPVGSSTSRKEVLWRSIHVALRHPLLGIGIGNFHQVSFRELATHNAYTQVGAEMGLIALYFYVRFITVPLKRLRLIERETRDERAAARPHYLAVGLQASLVGYMVSSFFASVAFYWFVYYLVGYAVCLRRLYEAEHGPLESREAEADAAEKASRRPPAWQASRSSSSPTQGAAGRGAAW